MYSLQKVYLSIYDLVDMNSIINLTLLSNPSLAVMVASSATGRYSGLLDFSVKLGKNILK